MSVSSSRAMWSPRRADVGRVVARGVAAGRVLDLDHRRAERAEELRCVRARERDRQVDDRDPLERARSSGMAAPAPQSRVVPWPSTPSGRASAGSTPTPAAASTSRPRSAGPRRPRPSCTASSAWSTTARATTRAATSRPTTCACSCSTTRSSYGSASTTVGRTSVRFAWEVVHDGEVAITGGTRRARRRGRPPVADRRPHARAAPVLSIKEPDTLAGSGDWIPRASGLSRPAPPKPTSRRRGSVTLA